MATRLSDARAHALSELRYEPTDKRVRALLGGHAVVDSTHAVLVWEPRRVLPSYAVPAQDIAGELDPRGTAGEGEEQDSGPILHGAIPFEVHTAPGEVLAVRASNGGSGGREPAAYRIADPDLADLVVLDFESFDGWQEEDETILGHPRDPFHRVDIRASSRHVRVALGDAVLAETARPRLVFETSLPTRFYIPREDVLVALAPTDKHTICAYKGRASYWAFRAGGEEYTDLAWSYEHPLPDAGALQGLVAFWNEKVDLIVDGEVRGGALSAIGATIQREANVH